MGIWDRARSAWTDLQGIGRLLPALPVLNPLGHWSCARLIARLAADRPQQVGLAYENRRWTWREIDSRANQYAHFAIGARLQRGDVVALLMDNRPDYLFVACGLNRAGIVTALLNTHATGAALVHAIKAAKPKALLLGSEYADAVSAVLPELPPFAERRLWMHVDPAQPAPGAGFRAINDEVAGYAEDEPRRRALPKTQDPMCYIYTSGTTGLPKAAVISNQRWLEAAMVFGRGVGDMTAEDVLYLTLPLYHSAGFLVGWGAVVAAGATLALRRKFSASQFWDDARASGATVFVYIGELCRYLLSQPRRRDERRHRIRVCMGNGLRADVWQKFQSRFRIPVIREYYGATEGNLGLFNLEGRPGMIGRLMPGVAIVKCDPLTGQIFRNAAGRCEPVAMGERGLLIGHINMLMTFAGYRDRRATRQKVIRNAFSAGDAYFNTGDLVQLHDDGWVSFADRIGDTFRWKGENVSTHEVAEILSGAKGVREVNVYGVSIDGSEGRAGMASLVVGDGFDLEAFARYVGDHLANYQRPYFVRLVSSMDVTATFKHRKVDYRVAGFDPAVVRDPLFYLDGKCYVRLDGALYRRLTSGEIGPR